MAGDTLKGDTSVSFTVEQLSGLAAAAGDTGELSQAILRGVHAYLAGDIIGFSAMFAGSTVLAIPYEGGAPFEVEIDLSSIYAARTADGVVRSYHFTNADPAIRDRRILCKVPPRANSEKSVTTHIIRKKAGWQALRQTPEPLYH